MHSRNVQQNQRSLRSRANVLGNCQAHRLAGQGIRNQPVQSLEQVCIYSFAALPVLTITRTIFGVSEPSYNITPAKKNNELDEPSDADRILAKRKEKAARRNALQDHDANVD